MKIPNILLSDGNQMPMIGLGTHELHGETLQTCVKAAYELGVRMYDTAWLYENEEELGHALKKQGIKREDVFLVSKCTGAQLWGRKRYFHLFKKTVKQCYEESCKKLGTDYLDLFMLHSWEFKDEDYKQIVDLKCSGQIKSFGITQATKERIEEVYKLTGIYPQVQQLHIQPLLTKEDTIGYMHKHNIAALSISIFKGNHPELLRDPVLEEISMAHNVTTRQVILRWLIQQNIGFLTRSSNPKHISQNVDIWGFELSDVEMKIISGMNKNLSFVPYEREGVLIK